MTVFDVKSLYRLGEYSTVAPNAFVRNPQHVKIGSHTRIDWGFYLTPKATIGDYIHIAPYVTIIGGIDSDFVMEDFTTIAAGSRIVCASDEHKGAGLVGPTIPDEYRDNVTFAPVIFKRFASIGTNVVVLPGVILNEGSVVGACSLLNKSTDPWGIYVGTPAKKVGERPREKMLEYAKKLGY